MALIEQKEAARLLGVSEDELKNMISSNEVFGYRDGAAWKFKQEELERVAEERGITLGGDASTGGTPGGSGIDADLYDEMVDVAELADDEVDSALVSEEAIGQSGVSTSSTIIGQDDLELDTGSDIQPAASSDLDLAEGSGVDLLTGSDILAEDEADDSLLTSSGLSDALNDDEDSLSLDSGVGGSAPLSLDDGGSDALSLDDDDGEADAILELDDGGDDEAPTQLAAGSDLSLDSGVGDDILDLDADGDDESPTQLAGGSGSFELGEEDDEDFVLGSGIGSDVTLGAADSGIGLSSPTDSGLSLEEEPLELGGSQVESLELGEDDMIELDEDADPEAATQLKAEDDFGLTPVDMDLEEESDSGSQVIALDTEQFDETADTMLAAAPALLEEDEDLLGGGDALGEAAAAPGLAGSPMLQQAPAPPTAKFSIWNVLSLMVIMLLLVLSGMLMKDILSNMWYFDSTESASAPVMEYVLSLMPEK